MDNTASKLLFGLMSDKANAKIRFLYRSIDDIVPVKVHQIYTTDEDGHTVVRHVKCLEDECPLCKNGNVVLNRLYIPIYNEKLGIVQIWERSALSYGLFKFESLFKQYPYLPKHVFKVTRYGEFGNYHTYYTIEHDSDIDNQELRDTWEIPDPKNSLYYEVSADEMQKYVDGTN